VAPVSLLNMASAWFFLVERHPEIDALLYAPTLFAYSVLGSLAAVLTAMLQLTTCVDWLGRRSLEKAPDSAPPNRLSSIASRSKGNQYDRLL